MSDKKKKNEDFYVIEDEPLKPKGKPNPSYRISRRWALVTGLIVVLALIAAGELFLLLVPTERIATLPTPVPTLVPPLPSPTLPVLPTYTPTPFIRTSTPIPTPVSPALQPTTISDHVNSVSWSPDGKTLAVTSVYGVRLYNAEYLNQPPRSVTGFQGAVSSATFSPDGKLLAIVSSAYPDSGYHWGDPLKIADVTLWDTATGQTRVLKGHTNFILAVRFSSDGTRLAAGSMDKTVLIWDTHTGQILNTLTSNMDYFDDLIFDARGLLLAVGSSHQETPQGGLEHYLEQWNLNLGETQAFTPNTYDVSVYWMAFNPQGTLLATSMKEGIWIQDLRSTGPVKKLLGIPPITPMVFSPDSALLAVAFDQQFEGILGTGGVVQVWDIAASQARFSLENTTGRVNAIAFSPDGTKLAVGTDDGRVQIREVPSGRLLQDLQV